MRPLFLYWSSYIWYRVVMVGIFGLLGVAILSQAFVDGELGYVFLAAIFLAIAAFHFMRGYVMLHHMRHSRQAAIEKEMLP